MKKFYQGKKILITGASSGIGRDLAIYLATMQAQLILLDLRREALDAVHEECIKSGAIVKSFQADISETRGMVELSKEILSAVGWVDIIVANAGIGGLNPAANFSLDIHKRMVDVNLLGLANTLAPFIPSMMERRSGHLVGISSMAAFRGMPNAASYSSTKMAQATLLESFRVDLRKYNIAVTCIHPGFIETPMAAHDDFKMPFKVSVRKSSYLIARAIQSKRSVYLYPWPMRILTAFNKVLPNWIYDRLMPALAGQKKEIVPRIF